MTTLTFGLELPLIQRFLNSSYARGSPIRDGHEVPRNFSVPCSLRLQNEWVKQAPTASFAIGDQVQNRFPLIACQRFDHLGYKHTLDISAEPAEPWETLPWSVVAGKRPE